MGIFETKYGDRLLTVEETARALGIAGGTLYHWISERRGPPVQRLSPRCIRFHPRQLDEWLERLPQYPTGTSGTKIGHRK